MAKNKILFECQACGNQQSKWLGKCPECGSWDSFIELKSEQIKVLKEIAQSKRGYLYRRCGARAFFKV